MFKAISLSFISVAAIIFFSHRLLCYMRHFQEGGYSRRQFKDWVIANGIYDKKGSSIGLTLAIFAVYKLGANDEIGCYWLVVIVAIQSSPLWLVLASTLVRQ